MKFSKIYNTDSAFEKGSLTWGSTEYHALIGYKNPDHANLLKYPCKVPDEWMILCSNVLNDYDLYFRTCANNPSQMFFLKKGKPLRIVPFYQETGPWVPHPYMLRVDVWKDDAKDSTGGCAYPATMVGNIANPDMVGMIVMEGCLSALFHSICLGDVMTVKVFPKSGDTTSGAEWRCLYPISGVVESLAELVRGGYYQISEEQSMPPSPAVQVARSINDGHWKSPLEKKMDMGSFSVQYGYKRAKSIENEKNQ